MPPARVDAEIDRSLREIVEFLGCDRTLLMEFTPDGSRLHRVRGYARSGVGPGPEIVASEQFPWYTQQLRQGTTLSLVRLPEDLPAEAIATRRYCEKAGLKSHLAIPLHAGKAIVAAISFTSLERAMDWPDSLISRLHLLGKVLVDAIMYRRAELHLQESASEWQVTFDAVRDIVIILNRELQIIQVNATAASFLGWPADQIAGRCGKILLQDTQPVAAEFVFVRAIETRRRAEVEVFNPQRNVWLKVSIDPILDASGDVRRLIFTGRDITMMKRAQLALELAHAKISQLKGSLEQENVYLRTLVEPTNLPSGIVGRSKSLLTVLKQVEQVAKTNSSVLITGETGTGKELIAAAIHQQSARGKRVMVSFNCAAIAPSLIENELFGRESGAYTGALSRQIGRFELAHQSTIFLDEVSELPLELQAKLLRVLQEGTLERLGSTKTVTVDIRVLAASNLDLAQAVRERRFREDLFYRLNVFPVQLPPLRERIEDIPLLVWDFVTKFSQSMGKTIDSITKSSMKALQSYHWPGNIRELRNVVERAVIVCEGSTLSIELPSRSNVTRPRMRSLEEVDREHIREVLNQTGWRVRGPGGAAEVLKLRPTTLESKMTKLSIERRSPTSDIS
ncbi:MAG: sigma 54-interacting transcriptional regulator [Planctomycetota bacterium]|nr:sigma 54-interacting transcriptional regulator [Planctomycetota bacterium]